MNYGHTDHTAAFRGDHATIQKSIASSEPPPAYAPDGNPNNYETVPGQGTGDSAFFVRRVRTKGKMRPE